MSNSKAEFRLWHYTPSMAGGVIACVAFAVLTGRHAFLLAKSRNWFCIPFVVGGLFELIGYAARAAANKDITSITPYVVQSLLILLAPILFAGSIYMILGRLVRRLNGDSYSIIRPTRLTKIFVAGDVFCFLMQSTGGGLLAKAKTQSDVNMGEHIILGGLVLQIFIFGFFVVVAGVFHSRMNQRLTSEARETSLPWKTYFLYLYAASACITIRNVCRVVEYGTGRDGYLLNHEWALYIYDFVLMALTLVICAAWYDTNIDPKKKASNVEIGQWS